MKTAPTPLKLWLEHNNFTQQRFADLLTEMRGVITRQCSVSGWASGRQPPGDAVVIAIEKATNGAIGRTDWPCWVKRHEKRMRRKAGA